MRNVTQVQVSEKQLTETVDALRIFGRSHNEGLVLWLGKIEDDVAKINEVIIPPQNPIRNESGVGYFISEKTLYALNLYLKEHSLKLIAQVHSHPGYAYHSDTDDQYSIVTKIGGFSLVIPDFGFGDHFWGNWAIYRLTERKWKHLSSRKAKKIFLEN